MAAISCRNSMGHGNWFLGTGKGSGFPFKDARDFRPRRAQRAAVYFIRQKRDSRAIKPDSFSKL